MSVKFKHWSRVIAETAVDKFGDTQLVCAGWSPSGIYHIGNFREAVTCTAIDRSLKSMGKNSKFIFVIDDFDPLHKIPDNLKRYSKELRPYLGHPINRVPDFTGQYSSYAAHFSQGAIRAVNDCRIDVEFVYSSENYAKGRYDKYLRIFLENSEIIDQVFEEISGSALNEYVSVICQNCGNMKTAKNVRLEGEKIYYDCISEKMYRGCDHSGFVTIDSHEWKLKWRLDWPARQSFLNVTIEPSGKDHSVAGGSVDTSIAIHRDVLKQNGPILEKFGFITLKGQKFSGSKGGALPADEISSIMLPSAFLYLVFRSDMLRDIDFNPESLEYGKLLDEFDDARAMLSGKNFQGREREIEKLSKAAELAIFEEEAGFVPSEIKFEELALVFQTSLRDADMTLKKLSDKIPSDKAKKELLVRLSLLENWLDTLAPKNVVIRFLEEPQGDILQYWTPELKELWISSLEKVKDGEPIASLNSLLREHSGSIDPKDYYRGFYQLISGKDSGPNATNLVEAMGIDRILRMIHQLNV
ncbi:MAG: lysine--tRNA ligase [Candidatus Kariarchaeaceae archaeon]|jgi:lysyl-tRNA synthetase class 1